MMHRLKVFISNRQKTPVDEEMRQCVRSCLAQVLTDEGFPFDAEVNVTFVDDKEIHRLNLVNRSVDRPTDVLSFPLAEDGEYDTDPETDLVMLGDVVISMETAVRQAKEYGHSLTREIAFLTVHSCLHLLGYDHMNEDDEKDMFSRQEKALDALGITRETEMEKMLSGKLYDPSDPELAELRAQAFEMCRKINSSSLEKADRLLRKFIGSMGKDCTVLPPFRADYGRFITMGDRVFVNYNLTAIDCAAIDIGDDVLIGPNVSILPPVHSMKYRERNMRYREDGSIYDLEYAKPVTIEKNCWIAADVKICGGVTIGEGSVIGAGSVVTRDIPPDSFAAGNPCRVIRKIDNGDTDE